MPQSIAQTIMLTTACSAGCSHCPFSDPRLEKLFLDLKVAEKILSQSESRLTVISGGEPFEHRHISELLLKLKNQANPFRIATGGHIDLSPWLPILRDLSAQNPAFQGISLGTDVLTSRCSNPLHEKTWHKNALLLSQYHISYSITVTLGTNINPNFLEKLSRIHLQPSFFYLRHRQNPGEKFIDWLEKLRKYFPGVKIFEDFLG